MFIYIYIFIYLYIDCVYDLYDVMIYIVSKNAGQAHGRTSVSSSDARG